MKLSKIQLSIIVGAALCATGCKHKVEVPQITHESTEIVEVDTTATDTVAEVKYLDKDDITFVTYNATNYFSYKSDSKPAATDSVSTDSTATAENAEEYLSRTFSMQWPKEIKDIKADNLQRSIIRAFDESCVTLEDAMHAVNECNKPNAKNLRSLPDLAIESGVNAEETRITLENIFHNIITFKFYGYTYAAMAAHPLESEKYLNYDIQNDKEIAIAEIIKPESMKDLRNLIIEKTKKAHESIEFGEKQSINNFIIHEGAITFIFNHYEIACYAEGIIRTDITFEELTPMLNEYGKSLLLEPENEIK